MSLISNLRGFVDGTISESALSASIGTNDAEINSIMEDTEFIQECTDCAYGLIIQSEVMSEAVDNSINEAIQELTPYLVGQGVISEAAGMNNPKVNYVRLTKEAQIKRLTKIIILKLARKKNMKEYKKYKMGTLLKKVNMEAMTKILGRQAEVIAKKIYANSSKGKVATVAANKKKK